MAEDKKEPLSHLLAGAVLGLVLVVYSLILNITGEMTNTTWARISYLLTVLGVMGVVLLYSKSVNHRAEFGNLFGYGMKVSSLVTLILLAFTLIYFQIFPQTKDIIFDKMREQILAQGQQISDEQIDQSMSFIKNFFMIFMVASVVFMTMIQGLIGALIGAAIAKKQPNTPFN